MNKIKPKMTPEEQVDAALDAVLRASGSALKHYTSPRHLEALRAAMRNVISESYIAGSNDGEKIMKDAIVRMIGRIEI